MWTTTVIFFVTSRLKEIINRGGEKISPREIDEALLEHPAVTQARGSPGRGCGRSRRPARRKDVTARELRKFAVERLADFKVPRKIFIVDELPKGPTGIPQRIGLAERLGLTEDGAGRGRAVVPSSSAEGG